MAKKKYSHEFVLRRFAGVWSRKVFLQSVRGDDIGGGNYSSFRRYFGFGISRGKRQRVKITIEPIGEEY